jgi:hypothetical protein
MTSIALQNKISTYNDLVVTSQDHPQHTRNNEKHHEHGGGASCPSSGKNLINPNNLIYGQPGEEVG